MPKLPNMRDIIQIDTWLREHHPFTVDRVKALDVPSAILWAHENLGPPSCMRKRISEYEFDQTGTWAKFGCGFCFAREADATAFKLFWYDSEFEQ